MWEEVQIIQNYQYATVLSPITFSLFDQNTFLSTLFLNTLNQSSSLNMTEQVPQPHKIAGCKRHNG
jgi:hypothetical protein